MIDMYQIVYSLKTIAKYIQRIITNWACILDQNKTRQTPVQNTKIMLLVRLQLYGLDLYNQLPINICNKESKTCF